MQTHGNVIGSANFFASVLRDRDANRIDSHPLGVWSLWAHLDSYTDPGHRVAPVVRPREHRVACNWVINRGGDGRLGQ